MNKQELIGNYKRISNFCETVSVNKVIQELEQLAETQKVTVPQFVADYIDISKFYVRTLHYALENSPEKVKLWLCEDEKNRQEIFARAWLDGYTVEKERRYLVKIKGVACPYLNHDTINELWFYNQKIEGAYTKTKHTRKELEEAGFGWVFDCPGIEIEEVE
jgi:hypothetical protein